MAADHELEVRPASTEIAALPRPALTWKRPDGQLFAQSGRSGTDLVVCFPGRAAVRRSQDTVIEIAAGTSEADAIILYRRFALPLLMQADGFEMLHASASLTPTGVVLLAGDSGAGKSTTAYALAARLGWSQWADDTVVFGTDDGVYSRRLPFQPRLFRETAEALGYHGQPLTEPQRERAPLSAVFFLEPAAPSEPAGIEVLGPATTLERLLAQAYAFELDDPARKATMFQNYADMAQIIAGYRLRYVADMSAIDGCLELIAATVRR
ncbi:MAG: hypothetical protein KJO07_11955 [Deltaproteobacteria bacterium]|nr:hypothetical protein [Deltaproteobacteria bacterium]